MSFCILRTRSRKSAGQEAPLGPPPEQRSHRFSLRLIRNNTAPFPKAPEAKIILLNTSDDAVAFKIKTTAPKRYCVRPNLGLVLPKDKVEIQGTICLYFSSNFVAGALPLSSPQRDRDVRIRQGSAWVAACSLYWHV